MDYNGLLIHHGHPWPLIIKSGISTVTGVSRAHPGPGPPLVPRGPPGSSGPCPMDGDDLISS